MLPSGDRAGHAERPPSPVIRLSTMGASGFGWRVRYGRAKTIPARAAAPAPARPSHKPQRRRARGGSGIGVGGGAAGRVLDAPEGIAERALRSTGGTGSSESLAGIAAAAVKGMLAVGSE